jgi:23S rRNA (pseudouridine1915-N3)-methyltransferase
MKISIITVGKKNDESVDLAIRDFTQRISKYVNVEWVLVPSSDMEKEGKGILGFIKDTDQLVLLDEKGKDFDSLGFSILIDKHLNNSTKNLVFIIGGAYGVSENVKKSAKSIVSLSKMTFPHQIVRLILIEQIYRAFSILKDGKYHHGVV